ncbi:MAG: hypothetical protein ACLUOI_13285 [Eisenbergiella sp.]
MNLGISGQALGDVMDFEAIVDIGLKYGIRHYELWPCNVPGTGFGYRDRDIEKLRDNQAEGCCDRLCHDGSSLL